MTNDIENEDEPTSIKEDLVQLDKIFDDSRNKRNEVINKLGSIINSLEIKTENTRQTEVQIQLINTYISALNANESGISRRVNSKLKHIETDSSSKHSAAVAEFLSRIDVNKIKLNKEPTVLDTDKINSRIEEEFVTHNLAPILDGELKVDPKDITT